MEMPSFYLALPIMKRETAPYLSTLAKPVAEMDVEDATVLYISKGSYRNATFGNRYFLLDQQKTAEYEPIVKSIPGWTEAIVYCGWFGTRLKTRGIALRYEIEGSEVHHNKSCRVVVDIATDTPYERKRVYTVPKATESAEPEVSIQST